MAAALRPWAADLLHLWFYKLRPTHWFGRNDAVDALLARRYAPLIARFQRRPVGEFLRDPLTARAAILLFDQVPRNAFRDSARAFASDRVAASLTKGLLAKRWDRQLTGAERQFVLMPLMHSEAIANQRLSVRRFAANGDGGRKGFARSHYAMVARFGRFPHRNAVLGRMSTPAELRAIAAGNHW